MCQKKVSAVEKIQQSKGDVCRGKVRSAGSGFVKRRGGGLHITAPSLLSTGASEGVCSAP